MPKKARKTDEALHNFDKSLIMLKLNLKNFNPTYQYFRQMNLECNKQSM